MPVRGGQTTGPTVLPVLPVEAVACNYCNRHFETQRGASLHERMSHGEQYHAERAKEIKNRVVKKSRWDADEDRLLAGVVLRVEGKQFSTQREENEWIAAQGVLPGRNTEAIKSRRRNPQFRAILDTMRPSSAVNQRPLQQHSGESLDARSATSVTSPTTPPSSEVTAQSRTRKTGGFLGPYLLGTQYD